MARTRPVFHKEIGDLLRKRRGALGWTLRQAADIADRKKLRTATRQVLFRLERGQVKHPDRDVLADAATLYGGHITYELLARRFFINNYGRDLPDHELEVQEASTLRGAYETASARVVELEEEIKERDARLGEVQGIASKLVILAAGTKSPAAGTGTRKGRGGHRKTG